MLRPMTLLQSSLASLIVLASGNSSFALPEAVATTNQTQQSSNLIAQSTHNACDLDTGLAARVVRNTLLDRTYNTQSVLTIASSAPGLQAEMKAQVTTLTQAPGKFRSEIIFQDSNRSSNSEYLITSNGEQAWIYDKRNDRYSTMSDQAFDDSDDAFLMGFIANIGLMIQEDVQTIAMMSQLSEAELAIALTESISPCQESDLSVAMGNINGQSYQTFSYEDKTEGMTMTGFMNRATGRLDYFKLDGSEDGLDFRLNEQIISRTVIPEVADTTFEFIPPATAQVAEETISIGPF